MSYVKLKHEGAFSPIYIVVSFKVSLVMFLLNIWLVLFINSSLDKTIFTFKNFSIVRNQVQATEEFCFHSSNYEHIKRTLDIRKIIPVIGVRIDVIKQKLKTTLDHYLC